MVTKPTFLSKTTLPKKEAIPTQPGLIQQFSIPKPPPNLPAPLPRPPLQLQQLLEDHSKVLEIPKAIPSQFCKSIPKKAFPPNPKTPAPAAPNVLPSWLGSNEFMKKP